MPEVSQRIVPDEDMLKYCAYPLCVEVGPNSPPWWARIGARMLFGMRLVAEDHFNDKWLRLHVHYRAYEGERVIPGTPLAEINGLSDSYDPIAPGGVIMVQSEVDGVLRRTSGIHAYIDGAESRASAGIRKHNRQQFVNYCFRVRRFACIQAIRALRIFLVVFSIWLVLLLCNGSEVIPGVFLPAIAMAFLFRRSVEARTIINSCPVRENNDAILPWVQHQMAKADALALFDRANAEAKWGLLAWLGLGILAAALLALASHNWIWQFEPWSWTAIGVHIGIMALWVTIGIFIAMTSIERWGSIPKKFIDLDPAFALRPQDRTPEDLQ